MKLSGLLRPEVRHFEPYLPGKPIEEVQRELGLKKIVKLASNENALGTSKKVIAALKRDHRELFRYPEGSGTLLRQALAKHWSVQPSEVILGAGSDELIELLGKTFFNREDEIIVSDHAFIRYKMAGDLMGCKTVTVPMKDGKHDLIAMAEKIGPNTKAIFIANPNNPTGTYVNDQEVRQLFAKLPKGNLPFVIFDEAYYEFARSLASDYPESLDYFRKDPRVIVLRTFSKIYGLAGMRVGYGIADKEIVGALDRVRPPFNVSSIAQSAARVALTDPSHVKKSIAVVRKGMVYLTGELKKLGLKFFPSAGNFLLIDVSPRSGRDFFRRLLERGVIVRAMDEYGFPNHVRVTIGLPEENQFFIRQLRAVLENSRS